MGDLIIASDGLPARVNGEWAETKLSFLDYFGPTAIDATTKKPRRAFIDLFAGPGMNVSQQGGQEIESGALRILQMRGKIRPQLSFTDAILVNQSSRDAAALAARVDRMDMDRRLVIPRSRITLRRDDANACLPEVLSKFNIYDYLLVFADPEAPRQWPWASVQALKAQGHRSVDLYMLFPLEMGIIRLLGYREEDRNRFGVHLTKFFGNERWREMASRVRTSAQRRDFQNDIEQMYLDQLRKLWRYADRVVQVRRRGRQGLYRMLFASNHSAGSDIAKWASGRMHRTAQLTLEMP